MLWGGSSDCSDMGKGGIEERLGLEWGLTSYEDVLVGGADELHGLLGEERHVFVDGVVGDVFIGAVIKGDEDVEEDCFLLVRLA